MNGQTDYKEIIIKSSGEELVKSLPIELRDILQELDLTEYLDDLFQSGMCQYRVILAFELIYHHISRNVVLPAL